MAKRESDSKFNDRDGKVGAPLLRRAVQGREAAVVLDTSNHQLIHKLNTQVRAEDESKSWGGLTITSTTYASTKTQHINGSSAAHM